MKTLQELWDKVGILQAKHAAQQAIAYYDASNGDLKFARKGVFRPAP